MYLIYEIATGEPRMDVNSAKLAEANLQSGEAYVDLSGTTVDTGRILIVDGQVVPKERPAFDPVNAARHLRTGFLADSDWTQASDNALTAVTKQAWADYRRELRDFPATIATIAANEELAGNVGNMTQVEELLPEPPNRT